MKRLFMIFLITVFALMALMPVAAFAEGTYTEWTSNNSLPTKGTYKLMCDVDITSTVTVGAYSGGASTLTLDLNGHTVKFLGSNAYLYVQNSGKLIIEDSSAAGTGKMTNAGATNTTGYIIYSKGYLQIDGGTIENTISSGKALYINNGDNKQTTCVMNGGTILNSYDKGARSITVGNNGTFIMNGGTVESKATGTAGATPAIESNHAKNIVEINDGTIKSPGTAIQSSASKLTITGGTIEAGYYALQTRAAVVEPAEGSEVSISAGKAILNPYSAPSSGDGNKLLGGEYDAPAVSAGSNKANVDVVGGTYDGGAEEDAENYLNDSAQIDETTGEVTCNHTTTEEKNAVEATCTQKGKTADICCAACGKVITEGTEIPEKAHEHGDWVEEVPATCGDEGSKYKTCTVCGGDKITEVIPATGQHNFVDHVCTVCNEQQPSPGTGDSSNIMLFVLIAMISAAVICGGLVYAKARG